MRGVHTMEIYLSFKKVEVLQYATTWMNLEDITLTELSNHTQKKQILIPQ